MIASIPKWMGDLFEGMLRPNVRVLTISRISPQVKKIRFQGDIARMNFQIGYANVVRVSETEYRNYTIAAYDKKEGVLDVVFHIHGNGVGSRYIDGLKVGDELYISNPRGRRDYDPKVRHYIIVGDETSLGLACSFFPVLKQNHHQFQFYFELDEENTEAPRLLGLENYTVFPKNGIFRNENGISELPFLQTPDWWSVNVVLTGNGQSVQTFRRTLKNRMTGKIHSKGYWLEGKKGL